VVWGALTRLREETRDVEGLAPARIQHGDQLLLRGQVQWVEEEPDDGELHGL